MKKVLFIFLLAFTLILPVIARADSQKILNPENGHYYQRIDKKMTWHEAKSYCEKLGGHLATVTSQNENNFIYNHFLKNYPNQTQTAVWLGGTDEIQEGKWEWVTGESWDFENWGENEPNDANKYNLPKGEDYLEVGYTNKWNDNEDDPDDRGGNYFICEWESSNQCSQSDLDQKYNEGYNAGYEAGKKFCQQNPSACGISVSQNCNQQSSPTIINNNTNNCSTFDFISNTLHIPCFNAGTKTYWFDFSLTGSNPITLQLKKFGENK